MPQKDHQHRKLFRPLKVCVLACLCQMTAALAFAGDLLDRPIHVDIPENTHLEDALIEWGTKAGLTVMINTLTVGDRVTHKIQGTLTARDALTRILNGSGLSYTRDGERIRVVPTGGLVHSNLYVSGLDAGNPRLAESSHSSDDAQQTQQVATDSHSGDVQEVLVTAQKRQERLEDVPISISVVSGTDLDKSNLSGVTEALNRVPGVATTTNTQGGGTQIAVRGVSAADPLFNGSSPIAYYLDFIPFGLVRSAFAPDADVYDLDRLEVLRGPQGTLYGANALNGVVRVLTKDADLHGGFDFKAKSYVSATDRAGGANYGGDMAVNIPVIDNVFAARVVVGHDNLSGWINSKDATHVNDGHQDNIRIKLNAKPIEGLTVGAFAWHYQSDFGAPNASLRDGNNLATVPQPLFTMYNAYGAKVGYDAPWFTVTSMTGYLFYHNTGILDLGVIGAPPGTTLITDFESKVVSEELLLNSRPETQFVWSFGTFYRDGRDVTLQAFGGTPSPVDDFDDTSRSLAVYGEFGSRFLGDKASWTLGARYFHDDVGTGQADLGLLTLPGIPTGQVEKTFVQTTPRAVLTWTPVSNVNSYISYSRGFRSGFPQDELVQLAAPTFPAVNPDKLNNYELGAKGNLFERRLTFDFSIYYIKWDDIQEQLGVPYINHTTITATVNGSSASGVGTDLALGFLPVDNLEADLSFSWNDLTQDNDVYSGPIILYHKGQRLATSPEYTAGGSLQYTVPLSDGSKLRTSAYINYVSSQNTVAANTSTLTSQVFNSDNMITSGLRLSLDLPSHWTASIYSENLNNERGSPLGTNTPSGALRIRPRTVGLQMDYRFK